MKKISIIIPVYNASKYLDKCLNSIINQKYRNLEIILVNDGSTDNSLDICKKYIEIDSRIILLNQVNSGPSVARNNGMNIATGDYIMFLDSDDWIDEDLFLKVSDDLLNDFDLILFPYIREYPNKSLKRYLFDNDLILNNEGDSSLLRRMIGPIGLEKKNPIEMEKFNSSCGRFYKKDILKNIKFKDIKEIGSEDLLFNINVLKNVKIIKYRNDIFYHYNKTNFSSITHIDNNNLIIKWKKLFEEIKSNVDINENDIYNEALNNRIAFSTISLSLKIINSDISFQNKIKGIRKIIIDPVFEKSIKELSLNDLDFKWFLFFLFCKFHFYFAIYSMLVMANFLKNKV